MGVAGKPGSVRVWGELDGDGSGWAFEAQMVSDGDRYLIERMTFEPAGDLPQSGLGVGVLRSVRMGPIDAAVHRGELAIEVDGITYRSHEESTTDMARMFLGLPPSSSDFPDSHWRGQQRGRRNLTELAVWAYRYVQALSVEPGRPHVELARRWDITPKKSHEIIRLCRNHDLLSGGTHGRAGGAITPTAAALLRQAKDSETTGEEPQ